MARPKKKAPPPGGATESDIQALIAANPPVMVPIGSILIDPNNANTHDRRSIDGIKGSIAKFGQVDPLLVRKATGVLIGGEGRLTAMQELGFTEVEARFLDVDQTTATGLALALNRTQQLSRFDDAIVVAQLQALEADGFDVGSLGWNDAEMTALLTLETAAVAEADGSLEFKGEPGGQAMDDDSPPASEIPPSQVRMVQLFLTVSTFPDFEGMVDALADRYGTANTTDTVMECLRREKNRTQEQVA